ncbi:MAG TPA: putative glycolipid-binding domain-containing protein, partial [Gemmatimonadaceae bacterium]|nr:putative glycolipid-binding domain-containing protein [Gemmatimonadaceae bacterium]
MGERVRTMLWRRLDVPGHDACRLERAAGGWRLDGAATFRHDDGPACLAYRVTCDEGWRSREGVVHGWLGARAIDLLV